MDIWMQGGVVGEIFELTQVAEGLPVPRPTQASPGKDVNNAASVHKTRSTIAGLGIEVMHRPNRRGNDRAAPPILKNQCVFTFEIA